MKKFKFPIRPTWLAGITAGILIILPLSQATYSKQNNPYSIIETKFKVIEISNNQTTTYLTTKMGNEQHTDRKSVV